MKLWIGFLVVLAATAALTMTRGNPKEAEILVSAASSLTESMEEIGVSFSRLHPGLKVRFNFGSSGALQRQIESGAPVDVFACASPKEMDALQAKGLLQGSTRTSFAANRLVLIAPSGSRITGWEELRGNRISHIAISDPASVPSGRYARQTLERRHLWSAVKNKCVLGENVRQTLGYVADRNAEAGLVFATDARIVAKRVRVVAKTEPGRDHDPIIYPAAVLRDAPNGSAAAQFTAFLQSKEALARLSRYGFLAPPK